MRLTTRGKIVAAALVMGAAAMVSSQLPNETDLTYLDNTGTQSSTFQPDPTRPE